MTDANTDRVSPLKWVKTKPHGEVAIVGLVAFWLTRDCGGYYLAATRPDDMDNPLGPGQHLGSWHSPKPYRFRSKKTGRLVIERRDSRNWSLATAKRWARSCIRNFESEP